MQHKHALSTACFVMAVAFMKPVQAEDFHSVATLKTICGNPSYDLACMSYVHGIVEAWMLKDLVHTAPKRYSSHGNGPTFCETINKVSDREWVAIVRGSMNSMANGFAANAVMETLSKQLCEEHKE